MAINPLPFLQNMPDPGQAFMQSFDAARQRRDQQAALQAQQAQAQSRQAQYQQWIQRIREDPSPPNMAEFGLAFPDQAKAVQEAFAPLEKAEREGRFKYNAQVFSALRGKDTARAKELLQERITAARNTRGREQEAAELEYWLPQIDKDPEGALSALSTTMYFDNPDAYKELYAKDDMKLDTSTIKNLVAEMGPEAIGTPEFKQALREERTKITTTLPGGGFFSGQADELNRILGGAPMPSNVQRGPIPSPKTAAEFNAVPPGGVFRHPDGTIRTRPGGGSSNATGGFRTEGDSR